MREFYADLKLDPRMVSFVEAHGTGKCLRSLLYIFDSILFQAIILYVK